MMIQKQVIVLPWQSLLKVYLDFDEVLQRLELSQEDFLCWFNISESNVYLQTLVQR